MFHNQITEEINSAYARQFNMVKLDIDALRHEIRKFARAGVLSCPAFSERQRAN